MSTTPNESTGGERPVGPEENASSDDVTPPSQPHGALVPPVRNPVTAVGAAAELPPRGRRVGDAWRLEDWPRVAGDAVNAALDAADRLGDAIASQLGLRREDS
jgi:hypothetical protein